MAAGDSTAVEGGLTAAPLLLIRDIVRISGAGFSGIFKKDCTDLGRRVSLLAHLLEEIRDSDKTQENGEAGPSSLYRACFSDLTMALQAARRLVFAANNFDDSEISSDGTTEEFFCQFQCVTWYLEKALANLPYNDFDISEEVQEQIELMRAQLKRATERYGEPLNSTLLRQALLQLLDKEASSIHLKNIGIIDLKTGQKMEGLVEANGLENRELDELIEDNESLSKSLESCEIGAPKDSDSGSIESSDCKSEEESKKLDSPVIPVDFLCPISLEIMKDPVIVATGQTYERAYIQRWIDSGHKTCPKTQQKLDHLTLTPNHVLRTLIMHWRSKNDPSHITPRDPTGDPSAFSALVRRLLSPLAAERYSAVAEVRSLSRRCTDNRILLARAGAIPVLVAMLSSDDPSIQDNAVTSILNLSIYDDNKELIMLANAVPPLVRVLRAGGPEARENAAATLFCLSLVDENRVVIGASGAIPPLVDLLREGGPRGMKDAATALFNLCVYHGNKGRAVRAGIVEVLLGMLAGPGGGTLVDGALAILSGLAGHRGAREAIMGEGGLQVLVGLMGTGSARVKENVCAVLVRLCGKDGESLEVLRRMGARDQLEEIAANGTERGRRKARWSGRHKRATFGSRGS